MQIKTYTAGNMTEALAQIKADLGPDAVILGSKSEKGRAGVTVTAALERAGARPGAGPYADGGPGNGHGAGHGAGHSAGHSVGMAGNSAGGAGLPVTGGDVWREEWAAIKTHLLRLMRPALNLDPLPARQRMAMEYLQGQGLCDASMLALYEKLRKDPDQSILAALGEIVDVRPWSAGNWPQKIHLLAGPYGAGKTTVAIRLALLLRKKSPDVKICLINADATRGNGRLLLKHYADLSGFAYKEAASTLELAAALSAAGDEDFDRVIVDLPGLPKNAFLSTLVKDLGLNAGTGEGAGQATGEAAGGEPGGRAGKAAGGERKKTPGEARVSGGRNIFARNAAVHLVLPPHYSGDALDAALARYRTDLPGSIVWTKLDEAGQYGQMVNVGLKTKRPVSALSYGPGLGNSLCPAVEVMLWRMLFKHELPGPGAAKQAPASKTKNQATARDQRAENMSWSHA